MTSRCIRKPRCVATPKTTHSPKRTFANQDSVAGADPRISNPTLAFRFFTSWTVSTTGRRRHLVSWPFYIICFELLRLRYQLSLIGSSRVLHPPCKGGSG